MDFVAIDIETANPDQASICAIGLVTFKGGEIVDERHIYVDPEDEFSPHHTRLHGIDAQRVAGAPTVPDILAQIGEKHGSGILLHHGPFDRTGFRRAFARHGVTPWPCGWIDNLMVARRTWFEHRGAGGYGLKALAKHYGVPLAAHHDALCDARAAGLLFLRASAETGRTVEDWFARVRQPVGRPSNGGAPEVQALAEVLADEVIVFTGKLSVDRRDAERDARAAGFGVGDNVTARTTILVVGDQDVRRLAGKDVSRKQIKAEAAVDRGQSIRIVTESDFRDLIAVAAP
ncbi:hypothetical protein MKK68_02290 [Methylobacterium sp. E-016]|uniref:exonuclease domain-containing protein n=1 Tax=Methylobacterium sp. E-016 TaxID=2836556 RepID=UPI001FBA3E4D|nr:exonuclease domain-containing protein [Methylobacterium sp. E-016]MCJ2074489.1 hypothetical protein [Methylobacterium sp. E-016]